MTKTFAALALAMLAASPALAASSRHRQAPTSDAAAMSSYASMPGSGPYAVGPNGAAIGTDPDPTVRQSLHILGDTNWSN